MGNDNKVSLHFKNGRNMYVTSSDLGGHWTQRYSVSPHFSSLFMHMMAKSGFLCKWRCCLAAVEELQTYILLGDWRLHCFQVPKLWGDPLALHCCGCCVVFGCPGFGPTCCHWWGVYCIYVWVMFVCLYKCMKEERMWKHFIFDDSAVVSGHYVNWGWLQSLHDPAQVRGQDNGWMDVIIVF